MSHYPQGHGCQGLSVSKYFSSNKRSVWLSAVRKIKRWDCEEESVELALMPAGTHHKRVEALPD